MKKTFLFSLSGQWGFNYILVLAETPERALDILKEKTSYWQGYKLKEVTEDYTEIVDYSDPTYEG